MTFNISATFCTFHFLITIIKINNVCFTSSDEIFALIKNIGTFVLLEIASSTEFGLNCDRQDTICVSVACVRALS